MFKIINIPDDISVIFIIKRLHVVSVHTLNAIRNLDWQQTISVADSKVSLESFQVTEPEARLPVAENIIIRLQSRHKQRDRNHSQHKENGQNKILVLVNKLR